MLRFILALIAVFALLAPAPAHAWPFRHNGRLLGVPVPGANAAAARAAYAESAGAACGQQQTAPACSNGSCTPETGLGLEPAKPAELGQHGHQRHTMLHNRDAQGVANLQAHYNRVGHHGGNPGYEGCGCAGSPAAAYAICCYSTSGMRTVDVGYARSASGMWYCCRRYQ